MVDRTCHLEGRLCTKAIILIIMTIDTHKIAPMCITLAIPLQKVDLHLGMLVIMNEMPIGMNKDIIQRLPKCHMCPLIKCPIHRPQAITLPIPPFTEGTFLMEIIHCHQKVIPILIKEMSKAFRTFPFKITIFSQIVVRHPSAGNHRSHLSHSLCLQKSSSIQIIIRNPRK